MLKFLISLSAIFTMIFASSFTTDNNCSQEVNHTRLHICYNYNTKNPDYVTYYATGNEVAQSDDRLNFKADPLVAKELQANDDDYYKSGKDRFHMCPDAIMDFNDTILQETYYYTNVVPGDPYTNRYRWTKIESEEVNFYENNPDENSTSITGIIYAPDSNLTYIGSGVAIPDYFYKCFGHNECVICYIMPNKESLTRKKLDVDFYRISLDHLNTLLEYNITYNQ